MTIHLSCLFVAVDKLKFKPPMMKETEASTEIVRKNVTITENIQIMFEEGKIFDVFV